MEKIKSGYSHEVQSVISENIIRPRCHLVKPPLGLGTVQTGARRNLCVCLSWVHRYFFIQTIRPLTGIDCVKGSLVIISQAPK